MVSDQDWDQVEASIFEEYIRSKKVLICDQNAASRSSLFHVFKELGANPTQLFLSNKYGDAVNQILSLKPEIVVTEFDLGSRCGLELLQVMREQHPNTQDSIFLIVTADTSQSSAARALEEEVDSYVLKPYTIEQIRKTIMQCTMDKVKPSPYRLKIREGKEFLNKGNLEKADELLKQAIKLSKTPSLAHYYLGQIRFLKKVLTEAHDSYQTGLSFNRIHYRCLVGLYDLLMKEGKQKEAYEIVKRIAKYFPSNPKRLVEVLRLAIVTGQYEDIEKYYAAFTGIDERNETLIQHTSAALVVCGKYYLSTKVGHIRAIELFRKAAVTAQGKVNILREIILTLCEYKLHREAAEFITRFPPELCHSDDFLLLRFVVFAGEGPLGIVLDQGRALITKGIKHERLYEVMIDAEIKAEHHQIAQDLVYKATKLWPEKKAQFEKVLEIAIQNQSKEVA